MKQIKWSLSIVAACLVIIGCAAIQNESKLSEPIEPLSYNHANNEFLDELAGDTWHYLSSDWARNNHLPWSWRSESMDGGSYANTAEIGLLALSWVAAYDQQRPWSPTWEQAETEVVAILDQLRAWQTGNKSQQPHSPNAYNNSVFYQWYWIVQVPPVVSALQSDHLVPSIDNAWLAVSLITIREYAETHEHVGLAQKADAILSDMNFRLWFDEDTNQFDWGGIENPQNGFVADYYSNENRLINFVARALGHITLEEYQLSLEALEQPSGTYNDTIVEKLAWDGSYFTYAAPALFFRETDTVYGENTLFPVTHAQIVYAQEQGYQAWGLSDAFDVGEDGYVQQGAPPTAMGQPPETRPGLVTPHASALALMTPLSLTAINNLELIAAQFPCAYHPDYGFRDSVMVAPSAPDYGECSARFSALAQSWIFLSIINYDSGFIWHYFYQDLGVRETHQETFGD